MSENIENWGALVLVVALFTFVGCSIWNAQVDSHAQRERFKADNHCKLIITGNKGSRYACDHGVIFETSESQP